MPLFLYLKEFLFFRHPPKFKKNHHRSIHNIRLQMIIDIQVFEFSNTCTVGASMAVVRLTSMEALILLVTVYIDPSRPPASGRVLECLPAAACGPTAPVSGCRPSVIVPALAHRQPPMSHRLNFTLYIASYIFL